MSSKKLLNIGFIAIALLCTTPGQGAAADHHVAVQVSAIVAPWFKAQAIQQTDSYQVTSEDLKRGYTDLNSAVMVQFQTNITQGKILLQVASGGPEEVLVSQEGTKNEQLFNAARSGAPQQQLSYDLRIVLTPEVVVGTYPLHLFMQATIL